MNRHEITRLAVASALFFSAFACGGSDGTSAGAPAPTVEPDGGKSVETTPDADAGATTVSDAGGGDQDATVGGDGGKSDAGGIADAAVDAHKGATISGHVVNQLSDPTPLPAATVALRDATGRRFDAITNSAGAFTVDDVITPYDVVAVGRAADQNNLPYVYLGLSTLHPQLQTLSLPKSPPPTITHTATVTLNFTPPACAAPGCNVTFDAYDVAGVDKTVRGGFGTENLDRPLAIDSTVTWRGQATLDVVHRALFSDATYQNFYVALVAATVADGDRISVNVPAATAIPTLGNLTVTATDIGVPSDLPTQTTNVFLNYPDGHVAYLPHLHATSVVTGVPNILGATLSVDSTAWDQVNHLDQRQSSGDAANLPLSTTSVALTVYGPPILQQPAAGASLSLSNGTVAWTSQAPSMVSTVDLQQASGPRVCSIMTGGFSFDLARISSLGLTLPTGPMSLGVYQQGKVASLDSMVDESTLAKVDGTQYGAIDQSVQIVP